MTFKYRAKFDLSIAACDIQEGIIISKSNIQNLKSLIPSEVDLEKNIDLMGVAFNAAVVNEFNKNGDGISTATALECINQFIHKPTNIEHNKDKIVGHIIKAGFSDYANSQILESVSPDTKDPFNIALGAVVYKTVDKEFSELLSKSTDPKSNIYNTISASWEIGFNQYAIAVGSKNLKDSIVVSDIDKIEKMKGMLRGFGGKGFMEDGTPIYRLIVGNVYPLGIGFTMKPAANVKGVISNMEVEEEEKLQKNSKSKVFIDLNKNIQPDIEKNTSKISQKLKNTVNTKNIMDLETLLSELKQALSEKKISQEAVAGMTSTFAEAIKQKDEEFKANIRLAEEEKTKMAKANEELKNSVEVIRDELKAAQDKIQEFENVRKEQEAVARFNARMEEVDSLYDLEASDASFIAEKIKNLNEDSSSFESFKKELEVFWASKNKAKKQEIEARIQAKIEEEVQKRLQTSVASVQSNEGQTVEEALANAQAVNTELPNNNEVQATENKSLREKFAAAFSREKILQ
jgi:hypothetical protein